MTKILAYRDHKMDDIMNNTVVDGVMSGNDITFTHEDSTSYWGGIAKGPQGDVGDYGDVFAGLFQWYLAILYRSNDTTGAPALTSQFDTYAWRLNVVQPRVWTEGDMVRVHGYFEFDAAGLTEINLTENAWVISTGELSMMRVPNRTYYGRALRRGYLPTLIIVRDVGESYGEMSIYTYGQEQMTDNESFYISDMVYYTGAPTLWPT